MASLVNGCIFTAAAGGTGAFGMSAAVTGYVTPATAGVVDTTKTYRYRAQSFDLSQWEVGNTVSSGSGTSFTRVVLASSNGNAAVNFTNPPAVMLTILNMDILQFDDAMSLTAAQQQMAMSNIGANNSSNQNTGTLPPARIGTKALDQTKINLSNNLNPGPADLNTNFVAGLYASTGYLNSPDGAAASGGYWYVLVQQWDGATYTQQTAWRLTGGNQMWVRNQEGGAWAAWQRVVFASALAAIASSGSAGDLVAGTVPTARLGSGTASATTFHRGDQSWAPVSGPMVAKAWVAYNSSGTVSASFNVTSITKVTTGTFALNLAVALSDTAYVVSGASDATINNVIIECSTRSTTSPTVRWATIYPVAVADPGGTCGTVIFGS